MLYLKPSSFGAELSCGLEVVELDAAGSYDALSYCWGSSVLEKAITVNGRHGFRVTRSLWRALQRVRQEQKGKRLWVDAVCIDQGQRAEKLIQVANMGRIYAGAEQVCVYFGECNYHPVDEAEVAAHRVKLDQELVELSGSTQPRSWAKESKESELKTQIERLVPVEECTPPMYLAEGFHPLREIEQELLSGFSPAEQIHHSWWRRLWTVQEILLAKTATVYCGPYVMSWYAACMSWSLGIRLFDDPREAEPHFLSRAAEDICMLGQVSDYRTADLHSLLELTKQKGVSVPQDRLFGLLGVLHDQHAWAIKPDYGLSARQVHALAMVQSIKVSGCYDIIFSSWDRHAVSTYPGETVRSCIPDFDTPVERSFEGGEYSSVVTSLKRQTHGRWEGGRMTTSPFARTTRDPDDTTGILDRYRRDVALTKEPAVCELVENHPNHCRVSFHALVFDRIAAFYTLGHDSLADVVDPLLRHKTPEAYQESAWLQRYPSRRMDNSTKATYILYTFLAEAALYPARGSLDDEPDTRPLFQRDRRFLPFTPPDLPPEQCADFLAMLNQCSRVPLRDALAQPLISEHAERKAAERVIMGLLEPIKSDRTWSGRFFITAQGLLGIGPEAMKANDKIAVFLGARSPFVIRPLDGGDLALVGDAFVLGLMHGEVRGMCERRDVSAERVVLQ